MILANLMNQVELVMNQVGSTIGVIHANRRALSDTGPLRISGGVSPRVSKKIQQIARRGERPQAGTLKVVS